MEPATALFAKISFVSDVGLEDCAGLATAADKQPKKFTETDAGPCVEPKTPHPVSSFTHLTSPVNGDIP